MKDNKQMAYLAAFLFAMVIGLSFPSIKFAFKYAGALQILAHRFLISFIVIQFFMWINKCDYKFTKKQLIEILPLTFFYPVSMFLFQAIGLKYIESSQSGVIFALVPIITLIVARIILKEKTSKIQILGIVLSVIGVIVIFSVKSLNLSEKSMLGTAITFLAVIASAMYNTLAKNILKKYNFLLIAYIVNFVGVIVFNSLYLVFNINAINPSIYFNAFVNYEYVLSVIYLGVFSTVCSAIFSNYALSKISASQMSVFSNLATLISIIAGILLLHESFYVYHIIGTIFILLGVVLSNFADVIILHVVKKMN